MATSKVSITKLPRVPSGKSDVIFLIVTDGEPLGKLRVSKGSLYWQPSKGHYGYDLAWQDFADLMVRKGTRQKYKF